MVVGRWILRPLAARLMLVGMAGITFAAEPTKRSAESDAESAPSRVDGASQPDTAEGVWLFNGRDLTGWWTPGNLDSWRVEQSELVCLNQDGNYLRTEQEYGDFVLSLEYLAAPGCNSGIGIRTPRLGWPSGDGIELQIYDQPGLDKHSTMALYGNVEPLARADRSNQWNHVVIRADGPRILAWVNDILVQDADTSRLPELKHRRRRGWIGFQDHGGAIRFRNVRLRELPTPGSSVADVKHDNESESPLAALLDRVMNSQRLAQTDAYRCEWRSGRLEKGRRQSIMISGPGALVRLHSTDLSGEMSVSVDDELTPRIRSTATQFHELAARFADDAMPIVTCIPFAHELTLTFDPAADGEFQISFVTRLLNSHETARKEPVIDPHIQLPRGYQPAIEYRLHQFDGGTHREHDPYPRIGGQLLSLAPGEERELLSSSGSGVALWLKLLVAPESLATDDLWLRVFVDGEVEPAIDIPAKYLFPGASLGSNYPNFLTVIRGGPTSYLAMPFASELRVRAVNRGARPIDELGATASVAPLAREMTTLTGRLRSRILPAGSGPLVSRLRELDGSSA